MVEVIPTPVVEYASDSEVDTVLTEEEQRRRREIIEVEDGHAKLVGGRRKRRREWIWRPLEDDILIEHDRDPHVAKKDPASVPLPSSAVDNNRLDMADVPFDQERIQSDIARASTTSEVRNSATSQ